MLPGRLPGGFIGVDVFFVISGFLISSLILDSVQQGAFSFGQFYARRIRRLLPALLIVLCAVFAAGWFINLPQEFSDLNKLILSSIFFVPNIRLWWEAGYFGANPNLRPLLHLWSLGVEEQFYLLWPLVILLFWNRKSMPWVIALLAGISFLTNIYFVERFESAVFYFPITRLWELAGGSFLAWQERRHLKSDLGAAWEVPFWVREAFSVVGLATLAIADLKMNSALLFPGWWALLPVVGTMLVIAAGSHAWLNRHALAHPAAVSVGLISYPLYLWHWPILAFLYTVSDREPRVGAKCVAVLIAVLLAWLTYHFIEKPVRRGASAAARRLAVQVLLGGCCAAALISTIIVATEGLPDRFPPHLRPFLLYNYLDASSWDLECFLGGSQLPGEWKASFCIEKQTNPVEPLVVLWGDSQAAQLRPGLVAIQSARKFRLGQMTAAGCAPLVGVDVDFAPFCRRDNDRFVRELRELKPDMVILMGYWHHVGYRNLDRSIGMLKQAGIQHVVVLGPLVEWHDYLSRLLAHKTLLTGKIPRTLDADMYDKIPDAGLKLLVEKAGATYVPTFETLCPNGHCITSVGDAPQDVTFMDAAHLRPPGSIILIRGIADKIFSNLRAGAAEKE
jgi:peptidoglycan/LPS O-acetylase OafA/YrhL